MQPSINEVNSQQTKDNGQQSTDNSQLTTDVGVKKVKKVEKITTATYSIL